MNALLQQLKDWDACKEGYEFSAKLGATTLAELWPLLQRSDWMLWLTARSAAWDARDAAGDAVWSDAWSDAWDVARAYQADKLRTYFPNPFAPSAEVK